nr:class I histocompatibility antigen, F10 alpha chain-like isoform X2 [Zootoca vivipara]
MLPRVPWIRKVEKEDPQYWHRNTQRSQGNELVFRRNLQTLWNRYNQSGGIHSYQRMYGCELSSDGRKGGHEQYSYDGRDFLAFDKETLTWTAADMGAQVTKRKWDAHSAWNQYMKAYLEETCIEWLQRYLDYGKETLLRTQAPVVKVTRKGDYDSQETLVCQVHGFYPKEIDANWVKDGEVWQEGTSRGLVAPNSDGTYYVLLSVKTDPKERDRFRCRVEHDSLEKPLDVAWEKPVNLGLIVRAILGIVAAILLVSVIIFFIRRKRSEKLAYKEASTSDQGSASSTRASDQPSV